ISETKGPLAFVEKKEGEDGNGKDEKNERKKKEKKHRKNEVKAVEERTERRMRKKVRKRGRRRNEEAMMTYSFETWQNQNEVRIQDLREKDSSSNSTPNHRGPKTLEIMDEKK
ncbi:hypothetical protein KIN20_012390, partial [Parelaphostrongylus tenuis]